MRAAEIENTSEKARPRIRLIILTANSGIMENDFKGNIGSLYA